MDFGMKRKRVVLSLKQKLDIINRLERGEKSANLAEEYNVGKSSVMDIKMRKQKLLSYVSTFANADGMNRRKTMKCAYNKELDQAVYEWYINMRSHGHHLNGPAICDKALEINTVLGGSTDFKASGGWLKNFKARHGLDFNIPINENSFIERSNISESIEMILPTTSELTPSPLNHQKLPLLKKSPLIKRKRIVLSLKQKLDIIYRLGNGESASCLAREYNVGHSSVQDIRMRQNAILEYVSSFANVDNMYRRKTMKSAYNKELDRAVYSWYMELVQSGQSVNGPLICDKAKELNRILGGSSDFKASTGWLQNFKSRHGLLFNDNLIEHFNDVKVFPERMHANSYADDNTTDNFTGRYENANSNQSYESLPRCDVILNEPDEGEVYPNDNFVPPEVLSNDQSPLMQAFDTVLDWAKNERECASVDVINLVKLRDLAYAKGLKLLNLLVV